MEALKIERMLPRRVRLRQCKYLAGERIRLVSECVADLTGDRNDAHDQQGTG
jgi:hypothetical protein